MTSAIPGSSSTAVSSLTSGFQIIFKPKELFSSSDEVVISDSLVTVTFISLFVLH